MFTRLSRNITDKLEHNGTISNTDRALYEYGLRQMFITLLNILTMLLVGSAMRMTVPAIIYTLAYIPLRVYAGGYHALTPQRCWAFSAVMLFVVLWILKITVKAFLYPLTALSLIACICIVILSPVEDCNKPLDKTEYKVYHFRAIFILAAEILVSAILWLLHQQNIAMVFELVWCSLTLMLLLGKFKNLLRRV